MVWPFSFAVQRIIHGKRIHSQQFLCPVFRQCFDFSEFACHLAGTHLRVVDVFRCPLEHFPGRIQYGAEFGEFGFDGTQYFPYFG